MKVNPIKSFVFAVACYSVASDNLRKAQESAEIASFLPESLNSSVNADFSTPWIPAHQETDLDEAQLGTNEHLLATTASPTPYTTERPTVPRRTLPPIPTGDDDHGMAAKSAALSIALSVAMTLSCCVCIAGCCCRKRIGRWMCPEKDRMREPLNPVSHVQEIHHHHYHDKQSNAAALGSSLVSVVGSEENNREASLPQGRVIAVHNS